VTAPHSTKVLTSSRGSKLNPVHIWLAEFASSSPNRRRLPKVPCQPSKSNWWRLPQWLVPVDQLAPYLQPHSVNYLTRSSGKN
jgi:hypothetical protein